MKARTRTSISPSWTQDYSEGAEATGALFADWRSSIFLPDNFPWCRELEANWRTIRAELDVVMRHRDQLPDFQDISPDQRHISTENKWKTFFFFAYGLRSEENLARCPETARLLGRVPRGQDGVLLDSFRMHPYPRALRGV